MNHLLAFATVFALSFIALPLAPAASAIVTPVETPAAAPAPFDMRLRFNNAVDVLAEKCKAQKATREEFAVAVQALRDLGNQYMEVQRVTSIIEKMIARMNELEVKARDKMLELMEFDVLKDMAIDIQFQGAMARMAARVKEGKATRLEYAMVYDALGVRLQAAKDWDPEIEAIVGRLIAVCQALEKRANEAIKEPELAPALSLAADIDAHAAVVRLGRRATKLKSILLIPADYTDVTDSLRAGGVAVTSDFMRKINARLEEIKAAVRGGRITRADFNELFKALMERARAAATQG
jgi:hypothetical protein